MTRNRKVLWGEGILLTPQHFQQWDRYHDHLLHERLRTLCPNHWGVRNLEIDKEALLGAELRVTACSGVFGDGVFFEAPGRDLAPPPRGFKERHDPTSSGLGVYLGVAKAQIGTSVCSDEDRAGDSAPFSRLALTVTDDTKPTSTRTIDGAGLNLRILFDGESLADYEHIKIAEIVATASGGFELDGDFVPSCLHCSASPYVMSNLRRVLEILSNKSEELAGQQRKTGGMAEALGFWLLHTVNSHLPTLSHFYRKERVHPEDLFLELSRMAGELCTFAGHEHPRDLPEYDHRDLRATFKQLDAKLMFLLDHMAPTRCVPIRLERTGDSIFSGQIMDDSLLQQAQFYISIAADVEENRLERQVPAMAKVTSRDGLDKLIRMSVPGIALHHMATPPSDIPIQPGRVYFRLEKAGAHWDAIAMSHTVACHIPYREFPELRVELMAVKEQA